MGMRPLSSITTPIIETTRARAHDRRPVRAVFNSLLCLALFKHDETETEIFVSHNDDPLCAIWLKKQPGMLDYRFTGRFVVITLTKQLAREKGLDSYYGLDFEKYLPEERKQLEAAVDAAYRARTRHRAAAGYTASSLGHMGRNSFA